MAGTKSHDKSSNDNRSRQLNPEHDAFWRSRGEPGKPTGGGDGDGAPAPGGGTPPPG